MICYCRLQFVAIYTMPCKREQQQQQQQQTREIFVLTQWIRDCFILCVWCCCFRCNLLISFSHFSSNHSSWKIFWCVAFNFSIWLRVHNVHWLWVWHVIDFAFDFVSCFIDCLHFSGAKHYRRFTAVHPFRSRSFLFSVFSIFQAGINQFQLREF